MDESMDENIEIPTMLEPISPIPSEPDDSDLNCPFICSECDMKFYSSIAFNSHKLSHTQELNSCDYPLPSWGHAFTPIKVKEENESEGQVHTYTIDNHVPFFIKEEVVYDTKEGNHSQITFKDSQSAHISTSSLMNNKHDQNMLIGTGIRYDLPVGPLNTDLEVKLELPDMDVIEVGVYLDPDGRLDSFSLDDDVSDYTHLSSRKNNFLNEYTDPFMNDHGNPDKIPPLGVKQVPILDSFNKSSIKKINSVSPTSIYFCSDESFNVDYESSEFPSDWEDDNLDDTLCHSTADQHNRNRINYREQQSNFIQIKCSFKISKIKKIDNMNAFGCFDCDCESQNMQEIQEHIMSYRPHIHTIRRNVEIKPLPCLSCEIKGFHLYQILSQKIKQKEDVIYACLDSNIISVNSKGIWKYFQKCSENVECDVFCPNVQNTTPL